MFAAEGSCQGRTGTATEPRMVLCLGTPAPGVLPARPVGFGQAAWKDVTWVFMH